MSNKHMYETRTSDVGRLTAKLVLGAIGLIIGAYSGLFIAIYTMT